MHYTGKHHGSEVLLHHLGCFMFVQVTQELGQQRSELSPRWKQLSSKCIIAKGCVPDLEAFNWGSDCCFFFLALLSGMESSTRIFWLAGVVNSALRVVAAWPCRQDGGFVVCESRLC